MYPLSSTCIIEIEPVNDSHDPTLVRMSTPETVSGIAVWGLQHIPNEIAFCHKSSVFKYQHTNTNIFQQPLMSTGLRRCGFLFFWLCLLMNMYLWEALEGSHPCYCTITSSTGTSLLSRAEYTIRSLSLADFSTCSIGGPVTTLGYTAKTTRNGQPQIVKKSPKFRLPC